MARRLRHRGLRVAIICHFHASLASWRMRAFGIYKLRLRELGGIWGSIALGLITYTGQILRASYKKGGGIYRRSSVQRCTQLWEWS